MSDNRMKELAQLPVFFNKNRVFRVYTGGKLFSEFFSDSSEDSFYPEEWICSSTEALNEGSTVPHEGVSTVRGTDILFSDLLAGEKELMLGSRGGLDILVKALDSAIRLPVQAHPDKEFSRKHFNSSFGKAESWYVLGAREGACIYFGFKDGVTPEAFSDAVSASATDKTAMEKLLNKIPVKPGDVYFIPARAVHAIGAGCLILEVQEPTDFTIQPEEWCADYHLSEKEMYIGLSRETALSVFDYSYSLEKVMSRCKITPLTLTSSNGCVKEALITPQVTPCFSTYRYIIKNGKTDMLPAPAVYVVTSGEGELHMDAAGYCVPVKKGDYFFAPHCTGGSLYALSEGELELVSCLPPEKEN